MKVEVKHSTAEFDSYRANRVKSLFNFKIRLALGAYGRTAH